jgi:hypothetical protein
VTFHRQPFSLRPYVFPFATGSGLNTQLLSNKSHYGGIFGKNLQIRDVSVARLSFLLVGNNAVRNGFKACYNG